MPRKSKIETIYLKNFIKTGIFGSIKIGSTKEELIKKLGDKYDWGDFGEAQIIKYSWYEFFYYTDTGKIFGIQNDHLQADCNNYKEVISFKNKYWTLDKWFLKKGHNITFKKIKEILLNEDIEFVIEKSSYANDEKIIKCIESKVTFDFCNEYCILELDDKGKPKNWKEVKVDNQDDFVLNGIRLFEF